ncbi:uncharacterized protein LOC132733042 [Ruditapes philippinarum]|uniref:uncharacterized protein LOC132733042 n=1 Tax=Ruditapes philippinarum TaxID=129788 RepID=UPI00295AA1FA|nr:uncharacterized protein LOC132733042 [Ruditapes philippinarum]
MNLSGIPQPQMDWTSTNLVEEFAKFQEHCELVFKGPLKEQEEDVHVTMLLLYMGAKGREIYRAANLSNADRKETKKIFQKVREHIAPIINPVFSRYQFNNITQGEKTTEQFITIIKNKATECDFGTMKDDMIRDRIIYGVSCTKLRERLLQVGNDLKLDKATKICQEFEYAASQIKMFNNVQESAPVHALSRPKGRMPSRSSGIQGRSSRNPSSMNSGRYTETSSNQCRIGERSHSTKCNRCGNKHTDMQCCPAKGTQCNNCKKWNHWSNVCKSRTVNEISNLSSELYIDCVENVDSIDCVTVKNGQMFTEILIGNSKKAVQMKLDTGSQVFDGIGLLPGECNIHVDPNATLVVHPPRRIPVALQDKVKQELTRMENMGVIAKISTPTEWCNNLVVTEKSNGDIRLCLDPRSLNSAIKRTHYPLKTLDDVLHKFGNAKYFTKLDLTSAYWSIQLSEESSYLTAFNSPLGVFRYLRCPYGLNVSGVFFLFRALEEALIGLEGVATIVDDICVWGSTRESHDRNLVAVLERALNKGIRFNSRKLEVGLTEFSYFGHVLTAEGLKADPAKIEAIKDMRPPTSKSELHVFCYDRDVIVENDHLPIQGLLKKPMHSIPARLQRLVLKLTPYRFQFRHMSGKKIPLADGLSRNARPETSPELNEGIEAHVCMVISSLPVSDRKLEEIRLHTKQDEQLCTLQQTIKFGWPKYKKACHQLIAAFWNYRDELSEVNGLIMKGEKIVMPRSLRSEMLKVLHSSHLGAQKCLSRARSIMFWPGISNDIIEMVNQCQICLEYRSSQQKEPLISSEIPDYPFQIAECDLFSLNEKNFMVMSDYYSSPAQLVQSRQLRSILPTVRENIIPRVPPPDVVKQKIAESKVKSKHYYDKNAKPLSPLNVGDSARIQRLDKSWSPAVVIKNHSDRSYIVETENGQQYRRNRKDLLKSKESPLLTHGALNSGLEMSVNDRMINVGSERTDSNKQPVVLNLPDNANYFTRAGRKVKPRAVTDL